MRISDWSSDVCSSDLRSTRQVIGVLETAPGAQGRILLDIMNGRTLYVRGQEQPVYLPLRMPAMPNIPARMRSSINRFNCLSVLWTALHLVEEDQRRSEEHTSELQSLMRISYAVFCWTKTSNHTLTTD